TALGQSEVALPITNLAPNTIYHFRSVLSNATTYATGRDIAFKTQSPSFGTWTPLANLAPANVGPMVLLSDGTVLARAYDESSNWFGLVPDTNGSYVTGTWHQDVGPMTYSRYTFCAAVLQDGRVLIPGGEHGATGTPQINNAEVYDPIGKSWSMTASVSSISDSISDATTAMLPDGRVLVGIVSPKTVPGYPL